MPESTPRAIPALRKRVKELEANDSKQDRQIRTLETELEAEIQANREVWMSVDARLDLLEDAEPPVEPPVEPPEEDTLSMDDQHAVSSMMGSTRIQLVPRRGKWRVDYRTPTQKVMIGSVVSSISIALNSASRGGGFPPLGTPRELSAAEQDAVARLALLGLPEGTSCSVRWEGSSKTSADTNWAGHKSFAPRQLIAPVDWIEGTRG